MTMTPPEKLAASIGHMCESGCGRMADIVVVQLATGETNIQCQVCHLMMMAAVVEALPEQQQQYTLDQAAALP